MAAVSRKDKLTGLREIAGGVMELVMATDASEDASFRRATVGFGVTSIIVGVGRARGVKLVQTAGLSAGIAVVTRALLTARQETRAPDRAPVVQANGVPSEGLTRRERFRGVKDIVFGVFTLAIVWDRSLERHERVTRGTIGAAAVIGGFGRIRQLQPAMLIGGTGYLVALGYAAVTAARRRRS